MCVCVSEEWGFHLHVGGLREIGWSRKRGPIKCPYLLQSTDQMQWESRARRVVLDDSFRPLLNNVLLIGM